jgi:hypothetical protein
LWKRKDPSVITRMVTGSGQLGITSLAYSLVTLYATVAQGILIEVTSSIEKV